MCGRVLENLKEQQQQQQQQKPGARIIVEFLRNELTNEHLDHLVPILNTEKMKWKSEKSVVAKNKSNHVNALRSRGLRAQS